MKPVTYDFDVVTDTPAPKRRAPEAAEHPPHADAEEERRHTAPPDDREHGKVRAAE
ncbi:MAG: hypothetical protein R3D05_22545 [Dongiaceae bacterium]